MKKLTNMGLAFLIVGTLSLGVVACGDDEDENGKTENGVVDKELGLRVVQVGDYKFSYDEKGRLESFDYDGDMFTFGYNPDQVMAMDEDGNPQGPVNASYTSQGYLKELRYSDEKMKLSASYTYDGSGHLTAASSSFEDASEHYRNEVTLTWRNDLLRMIVWKEEDYDHDGGTDSETHRATFEYDAENPVENPYLQMAPSLMEFAVLGDGEPEQALAYVGKLGKGPRLLPQSCEREWEEDDNGRTSSGGNTRKFKYGFNIDNALSYVTVDSKRYNYRYDFIE